MRRRLTLVLVAIVTAAVAIVLAMLLGVRVRDWMEGNLFDQYVSQEAVIADQVAGNLEHEMSGVKDKLELAALLPAVQAGTDQAACNAKLNDVFGILEARLGNLGRIGAKGAFVCSVNKALIGVQGSKLGSYVTEIFNDPAHKPVLSHVILPPGATYAVAMHVPVFTTKGQFDGTLGGAVYLKDLQDKFLNNVKFAKNGFAVLLDDNGDVLYHPKSDLIGKNLDSPEVKALLPNVDVLKQAVAEAKIGKRGTIRYMLDGVEKVGAYRPATVLPGRNWMVMATVPVEDAADILQAVGLDQAYWTAIGITSLTIMVTVVVWLVSNFRAIRLQETLEIEKRKAQTLLSSIGDGVVAVDRNQQVVLLNRMAEQLTGWKEQEALGKPLRRVMKLLREYDRTEDMGFISEALTKGEMRHMAQNTLLMRRDGTEIPVGDSAAPVFDAAGKVTGVVVVFRDTTEEKKAAQVKSEFAYASHQFRTPVTQAMSALSLAEEETDPKILKDDLAMARVGMESVHKLTVNLLALSDLESGRVQVKSEPVDMPALMKEVAADQKDVRVDAQADLPKVTTDPHLLKLIMSELIKNAEEYRQSGSMVRVVARVEDKTCVIEVHNRGAAISKEDLPMMFTKFFRGSNRGEMTSGGGLGLYLVRSYVALIGGKAAVESGETGTVFRVTLPL